MQVLHMIFSSFKGRNMDFRELGVKSKIFWILAAATLAIDLETCASDANLPTGSVCENVQSLQMVGCLQNEVVEHPSDPRNWLSLGKVFHEQGSITEAKLAYNSVINLSPLSFLAAEAYLHRGIIHQTDGNLDEALISYQRSVKIKPTSANTLLNMAIILHTKGHYEAAITACKRAISTEPTYFAAYANMGILHQRNGDTHKAIETYIEAIQLKPDFAPAYFNLGTAFESAGEISKAIEKYVEALKLNGDPQSANPKFHGRLSTALVEAGHLQRNVLLSFDVSRHCRPIGTVCKHEKTCLGTSSRELDPSFFLNVGMVYLDSYLNLQSIRTFLEWAEAMFRLAAARGGGNFHTAYFLLGQVFELKHDFEAAADNYQKALQSRQDSGLYSHALNRLRRSGGLDEDYIKGNSGEHGMFARVDDAVHETVDRYGCTSRFLTPLRVLRRIARSQEQMMSYTAVTVNAAPPLLSIAPERYIISDVISEIYLEGGWKGLVISDSAKDLSAYRRHFERRNISNISFISTRNTSVEYTVSTIHEQLVVILESSKDAENKSLDFLRLDNVTCACDIMLSILNGSVRHRPLVPKLVMLQVNPALPPPVRTNICPQNGGREEGVWGCSLAEAAVTMERFGYVLVQMDYSDAMFVLTSYMSIIQSLPPNHYTAFQLGYASRIERLRCLGLYRSSVNHPEGDSWSRHSDAARIKAEYTAYSRDPASYIPGNPGRGTSPNIRPPETISQAAPE